MSKGQTHLKIVSAKIEEKIKSMTAEIEEVHKDIESMNDYYWQNYTEMDQYGYENFDNKRALFTQINANQENLKTLSKLKKMKGSPFFGSVEFQYEGEEEGEDFFIGIGNFAEKTGKLPLVYDWRAPVSSLFYDFDKGPASYEAPGGVMEGEILSKWQYKIRNGKMIYEFESDVKIDDDILKQELGASGDVQLKNIVRTIQKEQNEIIRNRKDKILVIQGVAGSGKTSVALHRIAYLLYHEREKLKSSNILILSPNGVFSDYISHVLPELGEEHISEMSFDLFAYHELKTYVQDCENRFDFLEAQMSGVDQKAKERFELKQSKDFIETVEGSLVLLEDELMEFRDFEYRGFRKTDREIWELFYYKFSSIPLLSRMEAVMEYVVDEYETLSGRSIPEEDQMMISEMFQNMYETTDLYKIYRKILRENGYDELKNIRKEERILLYEDVYPMLYLKHRLLKNKQRKEVRHLVIDEMQDYSYLQYVIIQQMFSCNMTILGDKAQSIDQEERDVLKFLPKIFGKQIRILEMKKSYRNTLEISDYARKYLKNEDIEYLQRHGKPVEENVFRSLDDVLAEVKERTEQGSDWFETRAILTMSYAEARDIYNRIKEMGMEANYIDENSSVFSKGLTVTTFYLAKGLEFDQVFVVGGNKNSELFSSFRYISATRALHELYIYELS